MNTSSSQHLNYLTAARGTFVTEVEDCGAIYGLHDVSFWLPSRQSWVPASDPDKFLIMAEDLDTAKQQFWQRWCQYIITRFNLKYIDIERK
jgi:hypothetical protein